MKTGLFSLNLRDLAKGLIMAILGAVVTGLYTTLTAATGAPIDWKAILVSGALAGLAYLIKNFFTETNTEAAKTIDSMAKENKATPTEVVNTLTN